MHSAPKMSEFLQIGPGGRAAPRPGGPTGRAVPAGYTGYDHDGLIDTAAEHGMAVIVIRVLAAGVIATDTRTGKEGGVALDNDVAADEARMRAVLPLLGPSNLRDAVGLIPDTLLQNYLWDQLLSDDDGYTAERQAVRITLQTLDARDRVAFRYFETGSPYEYELVRLLITTKRELDVEK